MDAVAVSGLSYTYPDGNHALTDVSFCLGPGEKVGLVGPNGAGKTTLFLCLAGVFSPRPGMVRISGLDPAIAAERKRMPTEVGIVFQNSDDQLFGSTVGDDVAFGPLNLGLPRSEVIVRVKESLEKVGLSGYEPRVPFHLSSGEKRRVALAGVLAMRPRVLLLDEPSIYLDGRGRRELIGLLQTLPDARILASHDLDLVLETCSRVLLMDQGKLIADGPARDILADQSLLEPHGLERPWRLC